MNRTGRLHAILSTARMANIPSVAGNVWLGVAIATVLSPRHGAAGGITSVPWLATGLLMLAGICLYVAGNFLNDWMDRGWDAANRPERALPRGLFPPAAYLSTALLAATAGLSVASVASAAAAMVAGMIVVLILIYTVWHKQSVWAVIPMGLCRALLPVMGAAGVAADSLSTSCVLFGAAAIALLGYIIALSISARNESKPPSPDGGRKSPRYGFVVPPAMMLLGFIGAGMDSWRMWIGMIPYAVWMMWCDIARMTKVFRFVSFLLAGIPLVDWLFLLPIGIAVMAGEGIVSPFALACLAVSPCAFLSGLLLQRIAPAT